MAWRHFIGNEEMQSGGSLGNQMVGRRRDKSESREDIERRVLRESFLSDDMRM